MEDLDEENAFYTRPSTNKDLFEVDPEEISELKEEYKKQFGCEYDESKIYVRGAKGGMLK